LDAIFDFLKMLNDASWASFGFFNTNIFPNRIANNIYYTTQCRV